jgi:hypothetical protein
VFHDTWKAQERARYVGSQINPPALRRGPRLSPIHD